METRNKAIDEDGKREAIYSEERRGLMDRQMSNSESSDKAILSLSSAFLGFSLAFLSKITGQESVEAVSIVVTSWTLFSVSIILTALSYPISQIGIDRQLGYIYHYYIEKDENYFNRSNRAASITKWMGIIASISFVLAIISSVLFVSLNTGGSIK